MSAQELEKAASRGKVIMDVIDIMDTHSEDVAENTETAVMPIAMLAPLMALWSSTLATNQFIIKPNAKKIKEAESAFMTSESGKNLEKIWTILQQKQREVQTSTNLKDTSDVIKLNLRKPLSLLNKKNIEILSSSKEKELSQHVKDILDIKQVYNKIPALKNQSKLPAVTIAIVAITTLVTFIAANIKAAKIQIQSSRVARWQSRRDLDDPKYFVQYTQEQIEDAKAKINPEEENKKRSAFSLFKKKDNNELEGRNNILALKEVIKDDKNYKEWKKTYNPEDFKITRELSQEELNEAKRDKEIIQRITKQINNKAEEYSENMETTGGVLIGSTPFLGAAIGAIVSKIFTLTGLGNKISQKAFDNFTKNLNPKIKENLIKLMKQSKEETAHNAGIFSKLKTGGKIYGELMDAVLDKEVSGNKLMFVLGHIKDAFNAILSTSKGRAVLITMIGTFITSTVGALIGLKLQKNSARAGRYIAKREIEKDPNNFIGYTDEDFNSVQNIKAEPKTKGQKFISYITFLPRVIKEYFEYEKYNNTQAKYNKKLRDELIKSEVTDEQLKEAKELQRKLFVTFENVDDKSQEYSESIEATTEMAQPFIPYIGILLFLTPLILGGAKIAKGGVPKVAENMSDFLAKHTKFLKGKFVQKYVQEVTSSIKGTIETQRVSDKATNPILNLIKSLNLEKIKEMMSSSKGSENELKSFIQKFVDMQELQNLSKDDFTKLLKTLQERTKDIDNSIPFEEIISQFEKSEFQNAGDALKTLFNKYESLIPNIKISDIELKSSPLNFIKDNLGFLKVSSNMTGKAIESAIESGQARQLLVDLFNKGQIPEAIRPYVRKLLTSSLTDEGALKIYQNLKIINKNLPKEEVNKIFTALKEEFFKNPDKFVSAMKSGELFGSFLTKGIVKTTAIASGTWTAISIIFTYVLQSAFASLQKRAGRLGVMKALDSLEDPKYYANSEPLKNETPKEIKGNITPQSESINMSPMLRKIIENKQN